MNVTEHCAAAVSKRVRFSIQSNCGTRIVRAFSEKLSTIPYRQLTSVYRSLRTSEHRDREEYYKYFNQAKCCASCDYGLLRIIMPIGGVLKKNKTELHY